MAKKKPTKIREEEEDVYFGDEEDQNYGDDPTNIDPEDDSNELVEEFVEEPVTVPHKIIGATKLDPTRMTSSTPDFQKPGTVKEKRAKFAEGTVVRTRTTE